MSSSSSVTPKMRIELDLAFKPMGPSAARLSMRAGEIIRSHVPINVTDWRNVLDNFKDDVWGALLVFLWEFEFPINPNHCRVIIEPGFPSLYQRYKNDLRDMVRGRCKKRSKKGPVLSEDGSVVPEEDAEVPEPVELTPELWEA
ncbi:hypothetical protein MKX01_015842 [Papaver californicum]|nr:hypothetical protein MKX01_015842 [Papaver californicum]